MMHAERRSYKIFKIATGTYEEACGDYFTNDDNHNVLWFRTFSCSGRVALLLPYISLLEIIEIPCDIFICQLVKFL